MAAVASGSTDWQDFHRRRHDVLPKSNLIALACQTGGPMYDWAEFRHFSYLLKILEKGGFRVAAEELHTSQPNLTVQAKRFQEHSSVRLFSKMENGRIRPTETEIAFIALARLLLELREEVIDALVAIERGEIGLVRFGSTALVDPSLFRSFCALHKEL